MGTGLAEVLLVRLVKSWTFDVIWCFGVGERKKIELDGANDIK